MTVFFFLVGMELKRAVVEGHLSSLRRASLPAFAAAGGMLAPAALYATFNCGDSVAMNGWAIPTATDIAFALAVLAIFGRGLPLPLRTFLLTLAVVDDLLAIIIIAVFGYLVFRIQKRLYSPQNVLKRVVSDKKCPGCGNAIDLTKPFCPLCSHEIQTPCPSCKGLSLKGMPYCSNCGKGMSVQK